MPRKPTEVPLLATLTVSKPIVLLRAFSMISGAWTSVWREQQIAQGLNPNPDRLPWATDLPEALLTRGQYDEAIRLLSKVVEANPNDGQTHLDLSEGYAAKGMHKEAIEELGRTCTLYGYPKIATRLDRAFTASGY